MKKKHPKSAIRTLREFSAGGLIWRRGNPGDEAEVVLVKPAGKDAWVLPKGGLEPDETTEDAAVRECREETGLEVSIDKPLGQVAYFYTRHEPSGGPLYRIFKRVEFFLMRCTGGDPSRHDAEIQEVKWFRIGDAIRRASYKGEREMIGKAKVLLAAAAAGAAN